MFGGRYSHTIDERGRVVVPAKFREILGDSIVLTKGMDKCLYGYSQEEWKNIEEKFRALPTMTNKEVRKLIRKFFQSVAYVELDKAGRFKIPEHLMEYASLKKDVELCGAFTRIEIWDKQLLAEEDGDDDDMDAMGESLAELGFNF